jgi:hypothetical protein
MRPQYHFLIAFMFMHFNRFSSFCYGCACDACAFVFDNSQQLAYVFCLMVHFSA